MSVRSTIMKALARSERRAAGGSNVVPFAKAAKKKKMPPQGRAYDTQELTRVGVMPWKFEDGQSRIYTRITVGGKQYMRREDGVFYKQMRDGRWTSMLTPPKGGIQAWRNRQIAKGVAAAGTVAAGGTYASQQYRKK